MKGLRIAVQHLYAVFDSCSAYAFGADGEWTKARVVFTQFRNVTGNDLGQFKDPAKEVIVGDAEAAKLTTKEYRAPWKLPQV